MHAHHAHASNDADPKGRVTDPVCGMRVDPDKTAHSAEHAGQRYFFCSAGCRTKFLTNPEKYLGGAKPKLETASGGTIYTCPMHPQIRQDHPGFCPICGMALEPLVATGEHVHNLELVAMTRRFWIGLILSGLC